MKWLLVAGFLFGGVGLMTAGCQDVFGCGAPDEVEYRCQPVPAGSPGCVGGPTYRDDDGHVVTVDPDKTFPLGCDAKLPVCGEFHPGPLFADCAQLDATTNTWEIGE